MNLLFGMPGGTEWIFIILGLLASLIIPISAIVLSIVLYKRNQELKKQIKILTEEKNVLLKKY